MIPSIRPLIAILLLVNIARAEDSIDYLRQIKPVLQARCYACHGVLKQQAGLRLDTAALVIQGGASGAAVKPGDANASELLLRITSKDEAERMPPEGEPLKPEEIAAITSWIAQGAKGPPDERPERDPRDHWAFQPPVRPAVPVVSNQDWVKNPIDAFMAETYQKHGLTPQRPADKRIWLRRVSLDLVGLPPTAAELAAFMADDSTSAYDKVVTRLLDSPQYGERWGRHWMDIWRYSDWWGLGAEVRNSQKHIWHWRDWIIESLNHDKGYDQMLREMLAADELYPDDLDRLRASGFLARQYFKFNRTSWLDETVEHTAKAMLGLTFNCAKCHDHKYDPFSQAEYYKLRAIFEPYQVRTDAVPGEIDFEKDGLPRAFDCNLDVQTFLHIRGDDRNPDKSRVLEPAFPAFLSFGAVPITAVNLPAEAFHPGLRPFVVDAHLKAGTQRVAEARAAIGGARKKLIEVEATAKVAMAKAQEPVSNADQPSAAKTVVSDDFALAKPDLWEMRDGLWTYAEGKLIQSQNGPTRSALRLKQSPPADFEVRLKFVTKGGETWKSVGLTFDGAEPDSEIVAYVSAYAGGPKSQVSYRRGADYLYPGEGAQARQVELNKPHEMVVRVRGTLVNVIVDGEQSIAYRLPIPRKPGFMQVITYDAVAEFLAFDLHELGTNVMLVEAAGYQGDPATGPLAVEQAKLAVEIAEKGLVVAEDQLASIKARAAADRVQYLVPSDSESKLSATDVATLINEAVRSERRIAISMADEKVSRAELEVLRATAEKKDAAVKELAAAKAALSAARVAIELPGLPVTGLLPAPQEKSLQSVGIASVGYTPLVGALKMFESNLESEESRRKPFPRTSTGRRSALANWITDRRHPLPARVAVNHIWSRHFGQALVPTLFDFGRKGTPPTHPELLDWLAVEFMEHGWSMKHMHRLIVTSSTYRLSSTSAGATAETLAADPDNRFHWRAQPIRMEAQVVRDSLLSIAGELDLARGGPSVPVNDETSRRRSLYFVHTHNEHHKFLSMFDDASVLECYRRSESIVPQQALALENSPLVGSLAAKIADRIVASMPTQSDQDFIRDAFLTVLSVEPSASEQATVAEALARWTEVGQSKGRPHPEVQARTHLIQALLNHNDFVTVR